MKSAFICFTILLFCILSHAQNIIIDKKIPQIDPATGRKIIYLTDTAAHPEMLSFPVEDYLISGLYKQWSPSMRMGKYFFTDTMAVLIKGKYYYYSASRLNENNGRNGNKWSPSNQWIHLDRRYLYTGSQSDNAMQEVIIYYPCYDNSSKPGYRPCIKKDLLMFNGEIFKETDYSYPPNKPAYDTLPPIYK